MKRRHPQLVQIPCTRILIAVLVPFWAGCDSGPPQFSTDQVLVTRLSLETGEPLAAGEIQRIEGQLTTALGTPDLPHLPDSQPLPVTLENLRQAAGPVFSTQDDVHFGLYRKHCVRCHGLTGDGKGPAAKLLAPYPRDFRLGKFKFKSTQLGLKPTRQDLTRTIVNGIPGTSMPGFHLLKEDEIRSLVEYVIYLTVRGETERDLFNQLAWDVGNVSDGSQNRELVDELALKNFRKWVGSHPIEPSLPEEFPVLNSTAYQAQDWRKSREDDDAVWKEVLASIRRGEELFSGKVANCSLCHGENGDGKVPVVNYDDWTKAWADTTGVDLEDRATWKGFQSAGALKPVPASVRNLRHGAFRGGDRPEDVYLRIVLGIEGTPMPAAAVAPDGKAGLTELQVWDLVNFCLSLRFLDE